MNELYDLIDVFKHFEKDGEFVCIAGQSTQAVTGMFNLYRASDQVMFPGEKILEDARQFSSKFLRQKQANNDLLDKWIITKDLPGEVILITLFFITHKKYFLIHVLIHFEPLIAGWLRSRSSMVCKLASG